MGTNVTLQQVLGLAKQLTVTDKIRLIEQIAPQIEHDIETNRPRQRKSLRGSWSNTHLDEHELRHARKETILVVTIHGQFLPAVPPPAPGRSWRWKWQSGHDLRRFGQSQCPVWRQFRPCRAEPRPVAGCFSGCGGSGGRGKTPLQSSDIPRRQFRLAPAP